MELCLKVLPNCSVLFETFEILSESCCQARVQYPTKLTSKSESRINNKFQILKNSENSALINYFLVIQFSPLFQLPLSFTFNIPIAYSSCESSADSVPPSAVLVVNH